jgi:hypothetical protein
MLYISHVQSNDATATRLHFALEAMGIAHWVDHVHGAQSPEFLAKQNKQALEICDVCVFVLSPFSIVSSQCETEWQAVLNNDKRLIVAIIEGIPPDDLPDEFWKHSIQYIDLRDDIDEGIAQLIRAIAGEVSS